MPIPRHPYMVPETSSKTLRALKVPEPDNAHEFNHTLLYNGSRRPTPAYVAKLSDSWELEEFMGNALLENAASITEDADGNPIKTIATGQIEALHPKLHANINRPCWTWKDFDKCFSAGTVMFDPLKPLWLVSSLSVKEEVSRISPRAAIQASGMSMLAVQKYVQDMYPERALNYQKFYANYHLMTYKDEAPVQVPQCLTVQKTEVNQTLRRRAVHQYAMTRLDVREDGKPSRKQMDMPLALLLLRYPSYGDDLVPKYVSLAREAAATLIPDLLDEWGTAMREREEEDTPLTTDGIEAATKLLEPIMLHGGERSDLLPNPMCYHEKPWRIMRKAAGMLLMLEWEYVLTHQPERLEDLLAQALASRMLELLMRRYARHMETMNAETLLGISRVTGVSPGVFLNYYADNFARTGINLFSEASAADLLFLVKQQEVVEVKAHGSAEASKARRRKRQLIEEIEDYADIVAGMEKTNPSANKAVLAMREMATLAGGAELDGDTPRVGSSSYRSGNLPRITAAVASQLEE